MNRATVLRRTSYVVIFIVSFYLILILPSCPRNLENAGSLRTSFKVLGKPINGDRFQVIELLKDLAARSNQLRMIRTFDELITDSLLKEYTFTFSDEDVEGILGNINSEGNLYTVKMDRTGDVIHCTLAGGQNSRYWYYYDIVNGVSSNLRVGMIGLAWPTIALSLSFLLIVVLFLTVQTIKVMFIWRRRLNRMMANSPNI